MNRRVFRGIDWVGNARRAKSNCLSSGLEKVLRRETGHRIVREHARTRDFGRGRPSNAPNIEDLRLGARIEEVAGAEAVGEYVCRRSIDLPLKRPVVAGLANVVEPKLAEERWTRCLCCRGEQQ